MKIRIGNRNHKSDSEVKILDILATHIHPQYVPTVAYYDVAILETEKLNFSRKVRPVCLPKLPSEDIHQYDNDFVQLIGWGKFYRFGNVSPTLKRVSLQIFPQR